MYFSSSSSSSSGSSSRTSLTDTSASRETVIPQGSLSYSSFLIPILSEGTVTTEIGKRQEGVDDDTLNLPVDSSILGFTVRREEGTNVID